jgi:hypothetical protein
MSKVSQLRLPQAKELKKVMGVPVLGAIHTFIY